MRLTNESHSTKDKILETAKEMALEDDYESLTIRDICKQAKISVGAFYYHFKSKEEMINEAFLLYDHDLDERLGQYDESQPIDSLKKILIDQTTFVSNFPYKLVIEYYRSILLSSYKGAINEKRTYYKAVGYFVGLAFEQALFSNSYTRDYLTDYFIKHVRGNLIHWCMNPEKMDVVTQTSTEIDQLIKMFSK